MPTAKTNSADKADKQIRKLKQSVKDLKRQVQALQAAAPKADVDPTKPSKGQGKGPVLRTASIKQNPNIEVRDSGVHGKGVFARAELAKGVTLIEYVGEILSWKKAQKRDPHNPAEPNHTFFFHIDDKNVIDAAVGGNDARWINHACAPNCEADEIAGRVFIKTLRKIKPGQELFYDYGLVIDEPYTKKLKAEYACRCGSAKCRGTMLAPKD